MSRQVTHWIGGKPFGGGGDRWGEIYDPRSSSARARNFSMMAAWGWWVG